MSAYPNVMFPLPMWTRETGLARAAELEAHFAFECQVHFAMGGSVMYRGKSIKDLDLIVYPHGTIYTEDGISYTKDYIIDSLRKLGYSTIEEPKPFQAVVPMLDPDGKRIDFFFMVRYV